MQFRAGWQDNIYFVLVEPKEAGNIGASARAIKNMGFRNLCLVNPPAEMTDEGRWFAHNAHDVLDSAVVYSSVAEAIKDIPIVVGTTRRRGKRRGLMMPAGEGASRLYTMAAANKVAILFGREAKGLFNEEVEECGFMLAIPSSALQPSLNLSHAVMIVAYELYLSEYGRSDEADTRGPYVVAPDPVAAPALLGHGEIEGLYERISRALEMLDYIPRGGRNIREKIMTSLKHFIGRAGLTQKELKMLHGLCYQVEKKMSKR
jgi:TrmH family RNA methyltransferase